MNPFPNGATIVDNVVKLPKIILLEPRFTLALFKRKALLILTLLIFHTILAIAVLVLVISN